MTSPTPIPLSAAGPILDSTLRGGAAALLLVAAIVFLRARATPASRVGVAFVLCAAIAALSGLPDITRLGIVDPLVWLCTSACVPLFWLFARLWFDDEFRTCGTDLALGCAYVALSMVAAVTSSAQNAGFRTRPLVFQNETSRGAGARSE